MSLLAGKKKVVFAGDGNLAAREGFVGFLDAWCRLHGPAGVTFSTTPLPGSLLKNYLRRFERDVFPMRPDLLVVVPGSTDILFAGDGDVERIYAEGARLLDELLEVLDKDSLLFTSTLLFSEDPAFFQNGLAREFNERMADECAARGVGFLDFFTPLVEALETLHPLRLTRDGMTLSPLGHFLLFMEVARFFGVGLEVESGSARLQRG